MDSTDRVWPFLHCAVQPSRKRLTSPRSAYFSFPSPGIGGGWAQIWSIDKASALLPLISLWQNPRRLPDPGPRCLSPTCASWNFQLFVAQVSLSLSLGPSRGQKAERNVWQAVPSQLEARGLPAWAAAETSLPFSLPFAGGPAGRRGVCRALGVYLWPRCCVQSQGGVCGEGSQPSRAHTPDIWVPQMDLESSRRQARSH